MSRLAASSTSVKSSWPRSQNHNTSPNVSSLHDTRPSLQHKVGRTKLPLAPASSTRAYLCFPIQSHLRAHWNAAPKLLLRGWTLASRSERFVSLGSYARQRAINLQENRQERKEPFTAIPLVSHIFFQWHRRCSPLSWLAVSELSVNPVSEVNHQILKKFFRLSNRKAVSLNLRIICLHKFVIKQNSVFQTEIFFIFIFLYIFFCFFEERERLSSVISVEMTFFPLSGVTQSLKKFFRNSSTTIIVAHECSIQQTQSMTGRLID